MLLEEGHDAVRGLAGAFPERPAHRRLSEALPAPDQDGRQFLHQIHVCRQASRLGEGDKGGPGLPEAGRAVPVSQDGENGLGIPVEEGRQDPDAPGLTRS